MPIVTNNTYIVAAFNVQKRLPLENPSTLLYKSSEGLGRCVVGGREYLEVVRDKLFRKGHSEKMVITDL